MCRPKTANIDLNGNAGKRPCCLFSSTWHSFSFWFIFGYKGWKSKSFSTPFHAVWKYWTRTQQTGCRLWWRAEHIKLPYGGLWHQPWNLCQDFSCHSLCHSHQGLQEVFGLAESSKSEEQWDRVTPWCHNQGNFVITLHFLQPLQA